MNKKGKCRLFGVMIAFAVMIVWSAPVAADQIIARAFDASTAFRVYNGYTGTVTWIVEAGTDAQTNRVAIDGVTNVIIATDALTNGTIALMATAAIATTNGSGSAELKVNQEPSLGADSVIGRLLAGTYTATGGNWMDILWDTSAALHYDIYLSSRTKAIGTAAYILKSVQAEPTGTGDITLSIYRNRVLVARKVITSPIYVNPVTLLVGGTNVSTNTLGVVDAVNVEWALDLPISGQYPVIIRAARASTATTGIMSAIITAAGL